MTNQTLCLWCTDDLHPCCIQLYGSKILFHIKEKATLFSNQLIPVSNYFFDPRPIISSYLDSPVGVECAGSSSLPTVPTTFEEPVTQTNCSTPGCTYKVRNSEESNLRPDVCRWLRRSCRECRTQRNIYKFANLWVSLRFTERWVTFAK